MATILLIDDDVEIRTLVEAELSAAGHTVTVASNGLEGFRYYRAAPRDIVITDLDMPEQDGLDTIAAIRREFPAAIIVAISDHDGRSTLSLARALGACETFEKPLSGRRLLQSIDAITSRV